MSRDLCEGGRERRKEEERRKKGIEREREREREKEKKVSLIYSFNTFLSFISYLLLPFSFVLCIFY